MQGFVFGMSLPAEKYRRDWFVPGFFAENARDGILAAYRNFAEFYGGEYYLAMLNDGKMDFPIFSAAGSFEPRQTLSLVLRSAGGVPLQDLACHRGSLGSIVSVGLQGLPQQWFVPGNDFQATTQAIAEVFGTFDGKERRTTPFTVVMRGNMEMRIPCYAGGFSKSMVIDIVMKRKGATPLAHALRQ